MIAAAGDMYGVGEKLGQDGQAVAYAAGTSGQANDETGPH